MKQFAVPLSKTGNIRWCTQHYGMNGWEMKPMVVPGCARCIAMLIFWKPKDTKEHSMHSVTAVHIPPYTGKSISMTRKYFMETLFKEMNYSEPYLMVVAGGRIDNPENRIHYKRSIRKFVKPFVYMFPKIQMGQSRPTKETMFSTLILTKKGEVMVRVKKNTRHPLKGSVIETKV